MDGLTFTSELVKALAWPAAAVAMVVLLRESLGKLLLLLKKLKYGDLEAEFGELAAAEIKEEADKALPLTKPAAEVPHRLTELAHLSPPAAVLETWREVESAARAALEKNGTPEDPDSSPQGVGTALLLAGLVSPDQYLLYNNMLRFRDRVAHLRTPLSAAAVEDYMEVAKRLKDHLVRLAK